MRFRPTATEERWLALARRLGRNPSAAPFDAHSGGWRSAKLLSRCLFFLLGLIAAAMIATVLNGLFGSKFTLVSTGLVALVAGEWLIVARRNFGSGIEEALEATGLTMLATECASRFNASPHVGTALAGAALAVAGLRLLNPLFTTLGVLALVFSLHAPPIATAVVCYGVGVIALVAGAHDFRRPAYDQMLDALVVVTPLAGYLWSAYHGGGVAPWFAPLASLLFAAITLVIGLRRRTHAPLVAFMLCIACAAYEWRGLVGSSPAARLMVWGCVLLLVSSVLERALRASHGGITSRRLREEGPEMGYLETAGSAALAQHSPAPQSPAPQPVPPVAGGGGRFSGGGASGTY
jgi:hypothetical protein